jgi:hypothetical protein
VYVMYITYIDCSVYNAVGCMLPLLVSLALAFASNPYLD